MKKTLLFVCLLALAAPSYAGVTRFTAKHVVLPTAKIGFKVAKLGWKIVF